MATLKLQNLSQNNIKVNFTNRGLAKVLTTPDSLAIETPDRDMVFEVSKMLSGLKFKKENPIGYASIPEFVGIDYVGYIVEKERLDPKSNQWYRIDEYKILGSSAVNLKDSRVAYGYQYRYRIKSIIKVTLPIIKESHLNLDLRTDIKKIQSEAIQQRLDVLKGTLARIDQVTNIGISSKLASGRPVTTLEIVQGLTMTADDRQMSPSSTAVNPQFQTTSDLQISRNLNSQNIELARGTITRDRLQQEINTSLTNFKEQNIEYKSYYYESEPSKTWIYVFVTENVPPPPPSTILIVPNSIQEQILITWTKPANSQRDIKYIKLYKRQSVKDKWVLLSNNREIDIDDNGFVSPDLDKETHLPVDFNFFIDKNVVKGEKYIYALTCVDAHGLESYMSTQIQAELNSNFSVERAEKKLKWISGPGALPGETNIIYKKFFDQEEPIIAKRSITLAPTNEFNQTEKNLIIRVTSLDTHETKEFKVTLKNLNVKDVFRVQNVSG